MTTIEAIEDLKTLKEYFEQESGATPICLEYAIEILEKNNKQPELQADCPWK